MSVKYLLPCDCGNKISVGSAQAGQEVRCSCGAAIEVPTMHGLRQLEQEVDNSTESSRSPPTRGIALGIALLGLFVLGVGGVFTYRTYAYRPVLIDMNDLTPWDTWGMWHDLRKGVRLPAYSDSPYHEAKRIYGQYMTVGIVIIVLGIALLACAVFVAFLGRPLQRREEPKRGP